MKKERVIISVANDENDDWLKKIRGGWYQIRDLQAHKDAMKIEKKKNERT